MKKSYFMRVIAVFAAVVLATVMGCTPEPERFVASVEYNPALGSVTLTNAKGEPAEEFDAGSAVTITSAPKSGYVLISVVINGEEAAIVGLTHTFTIVADTTISVTFAVEQGTEA